MRKPWEMHTASRMQNIVQIRKKKTLLRDQLNKQAWNNCFGALGVESPHGGAMDMLARETSAVKGSEATAATERDVLTAGCQSAGLENADSQINRETNAAEGSRARTLSCTESLVAPEKSAAEDSKATATAAAELDRPEGRGSLTAPETT